jgi:hypothetical protein
LTHDCSYHACDAIVVGFVVEVGFSALVVAAGFVGGVVLAVVFDASGVEADGVVAPGVALLAGVDDVGVDAVDDGVALPVALVVRVSRVDGVIDGVVVEAVV